MCITYWRKPSATGGGDQSTMTTIDRPMLSNRGQCAVLVRGTLVVMVIDRTDRTERVARIELALSGPRVETQQHVR